MRIRSKGKVAWSVLVCAVGATGARAQVATSNVSFQNGVGGYAGAVDRLITASGSGNLTGANVNTSNGTSSYFIDGGTTTVNDTGANHALLRFDNIIGAGAIPAGAIIWNATLDVKTTGTSNSQTNNAINVYPPTTAFDATATWANPFGGDGTIGDVGPIAGSFDGMTTVNSAASARVDKAVQAWVNGGANNGFAIRSDLGVDGWSINTTGAATVADRPKLSVTYTTDPNARLLTYQRGVNGYAGTADRFPNGRGTSSNTPVNGSAVAAEGFVDGNGGGGTDQPYLIRFNGIDLAGLTSVERAELVIKTGGPGNSSANSGGPFTVHRLLRDWSTSTTYADMDSDGNAALTDVNELLAHGDIAPAATTLTGMNNTEVIYADITSIVEAWRAGAPNYGIYIGANGTTDGWGFYASGASEPTLAPELRILGSTAPAVPEPGVMGLGGIGALGVVGRRRRRVH